ncbi:MAG: hypothetical protein RIE16_06185, partial [Rhodospirillales bacterium]
KALSDVVALRAEFSGNNAGLGGSADRARGKLILWDASEHPEGTGDPESATSIHYTFQQKLSIYSYFLAI